MQKNPDKNKSDGVNVTVKKKSKLTFLDKYILICLFVFVFLFRYVTPMYEKWYLFCLFIGIYYLLTALTISIDIFDWIILTLLLIYLFVTISVYGLGINLVKNLLLSFFPAFMMFHFIILINKYCVAVLFELNKKILKLLNIYFFVNAVIIYIQYTTETFMMSRFIGKGMFLFDQMTGFMGIFGTGILNIFWVTLLLANAWMYVSTKRKNYLLLVISEFCVMLTLSNFNEIKSFIPTAVAFFVIFREIEKQYSTKHNKINISFYAMFLLLFLLCLYMPTIQELIIKIVETGSEFSLKKMPPTTNERAYLLWLGFYFYDVSFLGVGLNLFDFQNQMIHKNIGINSLILSLFQGGIYYYMILLVFYANIAAKFIKHQKKIRSLLLCISLFLFLSVITQSFRDFYITFILGYLFFNAYLRKEYCLNKEDLKSNV